MNSFSKLNITIEKQEDKKIKITALATNVDSENAPINSAFEIKYIPDDLNANLTKEQILHMCDQCVENTLN